MKRSAWRWVVGRCAWNARNGVIWATTWPPRRCAAFRGRWFTGAQRARTRPTTMPGFLKFVLRTRWASCVMRRRRTVGREWGYLGRGGPVTRRRRKTPANVHRRAERPLTAFKCARFCRIRVTRAASAGMQQPCRWRETRQTRTNCLTQSRFCAARNAQCINPGVCQQQIAALPRWHALCNPPGLVGFRRALHARVPRETRRAFRAPHGDEYYVK